MPEDEDKNKITKHIFIISTGYKNRNEKKKTLKWNKGEREKLSRKEKLRLKSEYMACVHLSFSLVFELNILEPCHTHEHTESKHFVTEINS